MLDRENDPSLLFNIRDTLNHLMQGNVLLKLGFWLNLCKSILSISTTDEMKTLDEDQQDQEGVEDVESFTISQQTQTNIFKPRWKTKVFAINMMKKIIKICRDHDSTHYNLTKAREASRSNNSGGYLVLYLSDLVRMSFMAATDNNTQLRMAGLEALQTVIENFSKMYQNQSFLIHLS